MIDPESHTGEAAITVFVHPERLDESIHRSFEMWPQAAIDPAADEPEDER